MGFSPQEVKATRVDEMDIRDFMSPGPMHLYNFISDLLDMFMYGVVYTGRSKGCLRFTAQDVRYEVYRGLMVPLCKKYGVVGCGFSHLDGAMGLAHIWVDFKTLRADDGGFFDAVSLLVRHESRRDAQIWIEVFEKRLTDRRHHEHWETERRIRNHGDPTISLHVYQPGPHPGIMNRVRLGEEDNAKTKKV